jgi:arsenate reductase
MSKKKVAFICVHNSCRSQIAEALGKYLASDVFESFSAGTDIKPHIDGEAVRLVKTLYGIDMEKSQYPKKIGDIPDPDIAISMGCEVTCPFLARGFDEDWSIPDPTGCDEQSYKAAIFEIEKRIISLKNILINDH